MPGRGVAVKYEITAERALARMREIASARVPDPDCTRCLRFAWNAPEAADADYFILDVYPAVKIKPCAACLVRRPYTWVLQVPVSDFIEWATTHEGEMIEGLKNRLPKPRRGGFEFL